MTVATSSIVTRTMTVDSNGSEKYPSGENALARRRLWVRPTRPGSGGVAHVSAGVELVRKHGGNADQHPGQQAAPHPGPVRRTALDHGIHRSPMRCLAPSASSVRYA